MSKRITLTTTIDETLVKKTKILAIIENKNMNDYIEEGLKFILSNKDPINLKSTESK